MPDQKSLKQQAEEAAELAKQVGGETFEAFKNSGAGKEVFGEDGKFGEDDKARLRRYVRLLQAHCDVARAHACAAGRPGKWSREIL